MYSPVITTGVATLVAFATFGVASPVKTGMTDIKLAPRSSGGITWDNAGLGACGSKFNFHCFITLFSPSHR